MMIFRFAKVFLIFLMSFVVFTGCERTQKVLVDSVPSKTPSMSSLDMASTPVKLVTFVDYPAGGKETYLEWVASVASTLQAPQEILRIRSYDNLDPSMRPDRMVEFEFGSFSDMENYLNRPEIAAILENPPDHTSTVHTFIQRSEYSKEAGDWKIKTVHLIDYPLGGKQAYLDWVDSVASTLIAPDELKAIASYDNYYDETPHRLTTFEFATQADAYAYGQIEEIRAIEAERDKRTASRKEHRFQLRSDYINTGQPPVSEPILMNVGLVLPLSGHLTETGALMKSGFDLAFHELTDAIGIRYIVADDKSTAEGAVAAFEELIHKAGVSVILGPASSSSTRAAFPIAEENEVVAISATAGARGLGAIGDFVFRVPLATDIIIPTAVEITKRKLGYQKVATLYDETDLFSTDRDAALQQAFSDNNVEVLDTQTYTTGTTDFTTQLTDIKALKPDALFVSALPPEKPAILIQARELGITVPILISSLTQVEVEAAGAAAEGALTFTGWLSTDNTPGNPAFVEKYQSTYGTTPNAFAAVSYACVHIFAEALKNAAATDAHSIRNALANLTELDTILGKFSFNADGDGVYEPNILIVRNGVLRFFD